MVSGLGLERIRMMLDYAMQPCHRPRLIRAAKRRRQQRLLGRRGERSWCALEAIEEEYLMSKLRLPDMVR